MYIIGALFYHMIQVSATILGIAETMLAVITGAS